MLSIPSWMWRRIPRRNRPLVRSAGIASLRKTSRQGIYRNDVALTDYYPHDAAPHARRRREPSNDQPRPRHHLAVGQGRPARDRPARLVDGARRALVALKRASAPVGPVVRSARGGCMRPTSIVNWFAALFASLELEGCSSHSGRRSFITAAARNAHKTGCSLRDVQLLAGHKSIEIAQGYIDGDTRGQRRLVALL